MTGDLSTSLLMIISNPKLMHNKGYKVYDCSHFLQFDTAKHMNINVKYFITASLSVYTGVRPK